MHWVLCGSTYRSVPHSRGRWDGACLVATGWVDRRRVAGVSSGVQVDLRVCMQLRRVVGRSQLSAVRVGAVWAGGRYGGLGYSPCAGLTARGERLFFGIRWRV